MGFSIEDGAGKNGLAKVNVDQRLETYAVTRTEAQHANVKGQGVNVNTEFVSITGETVLLYIKNTRSAKVSGESQVFHVTDLAVQFGKPTGAFAGRATFSVDFGGSGGTVISSAAAAAIKSNQNPGSVETFDHLLCYVGADGETVTGVTKQAFFDIEGAEGSRVFGSFDWVLPQGQALSVKVDPNLSSGALDVYVNIAGYFATEGI